MEICVYEYMWCMTGRLLLKAVLIYLVNMDCRHNSVFNKTFHTLSKTVLASAKRLTEYR